jgi:hypothetical protein
MAAPDACAAFIKALHEDKDRITDIVFEKIQESPSFVLNRIPDGGMTNFNDQLDNIEYRAAKQAFRQYDELNDDPRALVPGATMNGVDCTGLTNAYPVNSNAYDPNSSCHDEGLLDFGQGYRIRKSKMFRLAITTPVICAFDFIRMGAAHVDGFFTGMTEAFTDYGMENFEANLQNFVIAYGEANASINSKNEIVLTTGGFNAPPLYRLSIPFLRRYRQYMVREGGLTDEGLLEIETTRQDALDAISADQAQLGSHITVNEQIFNDTRGAYYSQSGVVWNGIKFIFNEMPVRGYFLPGSVTAGGEQLYTFVRVYHWKNEPNEAGGLSWEANHDYDKSYVVCNGVSYPMVSLAFVINAKSFKRYGLGKPSRIKGQNAGTNFEMIVLDGSFITCNDFNDKFRLAARHMFRFKSIKPQLSGAIAYRHGVPDDYVILPENGAVELPAPAFVGPQEFGPSGVSPCCPAVTGAVANAINVTPVGGPGGTPDLKVVYTGGTASLTISVTRKGDGDGTLTITPTLAIVAGQPVGSIGSLTPAPLVWADKQVGTKKLTIPITDVLAGADADGESTFTIALAKSGTTLDTLSPDEDNITVSVYDGR